MKMVCVADLWTGFCNQFCLDAVINVAPSSSPFLDTVLKRYIYLWKAPRNAIRDLLFTALLPEFDFKRMFAVKYAQVCRIDRIGGSFALKKAPVIHYCIVFDA